MRWNLFSLKRLNGISNNSSLDWFKKCTFDHYTHKKVLPKNRFFWDSFWLKLFWGALLGRILYTPFAMFEENSFHLWILFENFKVKKCKKGPSKFYATRQNYEMKRATHPFDLYTHYPSLPCNLFSQPNLKTFMPTYPVLLCVLSPTYPLLEAYLQYLYHS